jgi:symplekin
MGVLIQLPVPQLQDALTISPELKSPLYEFAMEMNKHQISHISQQVLDLLSGTAIDIPSSSSGDVEMRVEIKSEPADAMDE